MQFRQIDLVNAESRLEEDKDVVNFTNGEEFDQHHGAEEDEHFPNTDEDVGEIAGVLHLLLDFAQIFDKS